MTVAAWAAAVRPRTASTVAVAIVPASALRILRMLVSSCWSVGETPGHEPPCRWAVKASYISYSGYKRKACEVASTFGYKRQPATTGYLLPVCGQRRCHRVPAAGHQSGVAPGTCPGATPAQISEVSRSHRRVGSPGIRSSSGRSWLARSCSTKPEAPKICSRLTPPVAPAFGAGDVVAGVRGRRAPPRTRCAGRWRGRHELITVARPLPVVGATPLICLRTHGAVAVSQPNWFWRAVG